MNNGEWLTWYDNRLTVPTYATGRSYTDTGGYAPVYNSGLTWPYAWSIAWDDVVAMQFKLNQFGAYRHPKLSFKAKRAGILNDNLNNYLVGIFNAGTAIAQCAWGPVSYSWQNTYCSVSTPYNQQLNYSGGWNGMLLSITGDGFGGTIDLLDVNYVYLTIEP